MLLLLFSYYIPMSIQRVKYSYFSNPSQISKLFFTWRIDKNNTDNVCLYHRRYLCAKQYILPHCLQTINHAIPFFSNNPA